MIQHTPTSIAEKPKTPAELTAENQELKQENVILTAQVASLQEVVDALLMESLIAEGGEDGGNP